MNDIQTHVRHPRPPRLARILANALVTIILRSTLHGLRSHQLLLLTFTRRKSGREFTTPVRYMQEGDRLQLTIVYPWWKNLLEKRMVRVLLRGQARTGMAEVFPQDYGEAIVEIHLKG